MPIGHPRDAVSGFRQAMEDERQVALMARAYALALHTADESDPLTYSGEPEPQPQPTPVRPVHHTCAPAPRRRHRVRSFVLGTFAVLAGFIMLGKLAGAPAPADATVPTTTPGPTVTVTVPPSTPAPVPAPTTVTVTAEPAGMFNPTAELDMSQVDDQRDGHTVPPTTVEFTPETTAMVLPSPVEAPAPAPAPAPAADVDCHRQADIFVADGWTGTPEMAACFTGPEDPRIGDLYAESEYSGYVPGQTSYFPPGDARNAVIDAAHAAGATADQVVAIVEILSR